MCLLFPRSCVYSSPLKHPQTRSTSVQTNNRHRPQSWAQRKHFQVCDTANLADGLFHSLLLTTSRSQPLFSGFSAFSWSLHTDVYQSPRNLVRFPQQPPPALKEEKVLDKSRNQARLFGSEGPSRALPPTDADTVRMVITKRAPSTDTRPKETPNRKLF